MCVICYEALHWLRVRRAWHGTLVDYFSTMEHACGAPGYVTHMGLIHWSTVLETVADESLI